MKILKLVFVSLLCISSLHGLQVQDQKKLYMQKLIDPPKLTKAQRAKVILARAASSAACGAVSGYAANQIMQILWSNINTQALKQEHGLEFCAKLQKALPLEAPNQAETMLKEKKSERHRLERLSTKTPFVFWSVIATVLWYKFFTKTIKMPAWTFVQILTSFISRWPEVKPEVPEKFWPQCDELYKVYCKNDKKITLTEMQAEVVVKAWILELI